MNRTYHSSLYGRFVMQNFSQWAHAAQTRFAEGKVLLSAQGGTKRFFTLFTCNVAAFFLIFFDATLCILIPVCAIAWHYGALPLVILYVIGGYGIFLAISIGLAIFFSIFHLSQYDKELALLDRLIPKLLPLPYVNTICGKITMRQSRSNPS